MTLVNDALITRLDTILPLLEPGGLADPARVVTRASATRGGIHHRTISDRIRAGRWVRLAPGVYLTGPPARPDDLRRAAALHGGTHAVLSGQSALAAYGFRVPTSLGELVLVPMGSGVASWGRIRVRRTARVPPAAWRDGVALAPPARAVADYVVQRSRVDEVSAVVASAVQRSLCSVGDLAAELEAGPRRGSRPFREALIDVGYGAHSAPEALAGRLLRAAGIHLEQNAEVSTGRGHRIVDFLKRGLMAVIEIDSTEYHFSIADHDATLKRDQELQLAGYRVLHVKPSQLRRHPQEFVELVRRWLATLSR